MASRMGVGVEVPVPAALRGYYLSGFTISSVHGRSRKGTAKAKKARKLHGHVRSERAAIDPWHSKGMGSTRH